jgi:hypothetical protein
MELEGRNMAEQKESDRRDDRPSSAEGTQQEGAIDARRREFYQHLQECLSVDAMDRGWDFEEALYPDIDFSDKNATAEADDRADAEDTFVPHWLVSEDTVLMTTSDRGSGFTATVVFENRYAFVRYLDDITWLKYGVPLNQLGDFLLLTRGYLYGYVSSVTLEKLLDQYLWCTEVLIICTVGELMKSDREVAQSYRAKFRSGMLDDESDSEEIGVQPITEREKPLFYYYIGRRTRGPALSECFFVYYKNRPIPAVDGLSDGITAPQSR